MNRNLQAVLLITLGLGGGVLPTEGQTTPVQLAQGGLAGPISGLGYITSNVPAPPPGFGYGVSFYENAWPLLQQPLSNFQVGLPSTWIIPDNAAYSGRGKLCPADSLAATLGFGNGDYSSFFQTIEGSMGFWGSTRFGTVTPKYRMNSTPDCYTTEVANPGWAFAGATLADSAMGMAQLSNRLLVAPDGIPLKTGTNNQFMGVAWMAMPYTNFSQAMPEYYTLTSLFQAPKNRCLTGNTATAALFAGGAYMAACDPSQAELWALQPTANGYYRIQNRATQAANLCLEGNTGLATAVHRGSPYMAPCDNSAGQLWAFLSLNGSLQLQTQLSKTTNRCLESGDPDTSGAANMNPCGAFSGQLWNATFQSAGGQPAVGNKSWTLFLNSLNFKGPVAYFIPDGWEVLAAKAPESAGRGMDTMPATSQNGAMEFNSVPLFLSQDTGGNVYSKIPRIQFPVDASGASVLMQDATFYSSSSLFTPAGAWLTGGPLATGVFDQQATWKPTTCTVNPINFGQFLNATDPTKRVSLTGLDHYVQSKLFNGPNCRWGLQWTGLQDAGGDGLAILPEYYRQSGTTRSPVAASEVPDSTLLKTATFRGPGTTTPYTSPATAGTAWTSPGPVRGPFSVTLSDGSTLAYSWYRFVDQPALQHLNLSATAKAELQKTIVQLHQSWPIDRDYMAPPSAGSLVTLDSSVLVTPPPGIEFGYVPIVTRQARAVPTITGVVNGAGGAGGIAPNTYATVYGTDLAPSSSSRTWQGADFVNNQLPQQLDGVAVTVNGKAAYVYFVSPGQLNILTPPDSITGSVAVRVTINGAASNSFSVLAQKVAPAFFTFGGGYAAATHVDGTLLGPSTLYPGVTTPAKPGETIVVYGNGFGSTTQPVVSGSVAQTGTLSPLPVVRIGGVAAEVRFAGLVAVGEYQFNIVVPQGLANGDQAILATYGGQTTQAGVLVSIQN